NDVALLGEMAGAGRSEVRHTGHPEELDSGLIVNTAATTIAAPVNSSFAVIRVRSCGKVKAEIIIKMPKSTQIRDGTRLRPTNVRYRPDQLTTIASTSARTILSLAEAVNG